ncbi:MAG TPA: hypothetical protein VGM56_00275 [Byssovorax sp.]
MIARIVRFGQGRAALSGAAIVVAAMLGAAGCAEGGVVRVVDGREVRGRFVSDVAYTWYAIGAEAEERGDFAAAARAFEAAASDDGPSADVLTRLGAARCAAGDGAGARAAFDRGAQADAAYAPLHLERGRCALHDGHADEALAEARRALALDPERAEASLLLAAAEERGGLGADALRTLHALTLAEPSSPAALAALHDLALRSGDAALAADTAARLSRLAAKGVELASGRGTAADSGTLAALDAALSRGETDAAERIARHAGLPLVDVAVRAAALGRTAYARGRAQLVVAADPADGSARVAAAVACDALGDAGCLEAALAMPRGVSAPSLLARLLLAELLERRVGAVAARAYLGPVGAGGEPSADALLARTSERVLARLALPVTQAK